EILAGGVAIDTLVEGGGSQLVLSGGIAISAGGSFTSFTSGLIVGSDSHQTITSGSVSLNAVVSSRGSLTISGLTIGTVVSNGGEQDIAGIGYYTSITDGLEVVFSGGVASGTTVSSGEQEVLSGGT